MVTSPASEALEGSPTGMKEANAVASDHGPCSSNFHIRELAMKLDYRSGLCCKVCSDIWIGSLHFDVAQTMCIHFTVPGSLSRRFPPQYRAKPIKTMGVTHVTYSVPQSPITKGLYSLHPAPRTLSM